MSDFDGVDFFKDIKLGSDKTVVKPGVYESCVIKIEEVQTQSGDKAMTVLFELGDKSNFDHKEYYNLWHSNADAKRISNEIFTQLVKAVGFDGLPDKKEAFVGKKLRLVIDHDNRDGKIFTKIKGYLPLTDSDSANSNTGQNLGAGSAVGAKPSLG